MNSKYLNTEGQIKIKNNYINQLFENEIELYRNKIEEGELDYSPGWMDRDILFNLNSEDAEVDRKNAEIKLANKTELKEYLVAKSYRERNS